MHPPRVLSMGCISRLPNRRARSSITGRRSPTVADSPWGSGTYRCRPPVAGETSSTARPPQRRMSTNARAVSRSAVSRSRSISVRRAPLRGLASKSRTMAAATGGVPRFARAYSGTAAGTFGRTGVNATGLPPYRFASPAHRRIRGPLEWRGAISGTTIDHDRCAAAIRSRARASVVSDS